MTVSTSACETNPESESSSSSGTQSEDEMPVPDARLFSSGKYERRFTWLYYNVAKGGYCCKLQTYGTIQPNLTGSIFFILFNK